MADLLTIENEHGTAVYAPATGAGLRSLKAGSGADAVQLLTGGDGEHDSSTHPSGGGCFIMAPWPNRIRDGVFEHEGRSYFVPENAPPHAIHGTVNELPFEIVEQTTSSVTLRSGLGDLWPFDGTIMVRAELDGPSLVQEITIASNNGESFPAGFGWHPWFQRNFGGGDVAIAAPVTDMWILDQAMTPTGERVQLHDEFDIRESVIPDIGSLDDCFRIQPGEATTLSWPELSLQIQSSPNLAHLQVYTPSDSICVEPQTAAVNAFQLAARGIEDTGAEVVSPERPLIGSTRWMWNKI
jgi:aldose 1-epimerase